MIKEEEPVVDNEEETLISISPDKLLPSNGGFRPRFIVDGMIEPESVTMEEFEKRKFKGDPLAANKIRAHPLSTHVRKP